MYEKETGYIWILNKLGHLQVASSSYIFIGNNYTYPTNDIHCIVYANNLLIFAKIGA